ncbi:MAG TPA: Maf family protein [Vicinamibacterales bacterium]|nr:Maf family protein [Vicinamibacterales bacterium]
MSLILASASPRRAELLDTAGFTFTVQTADVDESTLPGEAPDSYVLRVARAKAEAVARPRGHVVLGADTTVVAGGEILGKPEGRADAVRMLTRLSGAVHEVYTGVVMIGDTGRLEDVVRTRVRLLPIGIDDIQWYVNTGEPEGKAGAYAIQGRAARFVDWIEGSWSNVVGLPVATVHQMLKRMS